MPRPVTVFLGLCAATVLVLLLVVVATREKRAFTLGVEPSGAVATLPPGHDVCQQPIVIPDDHAAFDRIAVWLGTNSQPGPPLDVTVKALTGSFAARAKLAGGYVIGDRAPERVSVGHVALTGQPLQVCLHNAGSANVDVYGNGDAASRTSSATRDGNPAGADISLVFERNDARSALALVPAMFERASLWRADWVGAWTYWILGAIVLIAVPALLALALRDVTRT